MKVWFDDPRQLVDEKQFLQFWPNSKQIPEERINAASRFIVYTSALLYVIRRDPRVFVLGLTILGVMYVLYKSKMVKETYAASPMGESTCQKPTVDNPMANVLMTDYGGAPNRLEACYYPSVKPTCRGTAAIASLTTAVAPGPRCPSTCGTRWIVSS